MFRMLWAACLALMAVPWVAGSTARACGPETACEVDTGTYRIAVPENADATAPMPVVLWFHGANGTGTGVLRNAAMIAPFLEQGYGFIAPDGLLMPDRDWTNWALRDGRGPWRDELAFALEVLEDVDARFGIDRERILVAGFSRGGSLVWDFACHHAERFTAFAPVAGAFWRPHPETCASGSVDLFHTHGFQDGTVPLEGRPLSSGRAQGDVFEALGQMREVNQCPSDRADTLEMSDAFWCKAWSECAGGTELRFCLHQGGHGVPRGWSDMALAWFEGLPPRAD